MIKTSIQEQFAKAAVENFGLLSKKKVVWELPNDEEPLLNIFSLGWMEDGRCGYLNDNPSFIQSFPRPIVTLRPHKQRVSAIRQGPIREYVCEQISCGSRHTLFIMLDCRSRDIKDQKSTNYKKVMITGLNQQGLCEEPGGTCPSEVVWDDELPIGIAAGFGTSFIISEFGNVYSFGNGRFGVLGHGDVLSNHIPRQVMPLNRQKITMLAVGLSHVVAVNVFGHALSWGRNHLGQLGLGYESVTPVLKPTIISTFNERERVIDISCGQNHCLALVEMTKIDGSGSSAVVYAWGEESRGQLGSGDKKFRMRPQGNRWLEKFLLKKDMKICKIAAGGFHNLALTDSAGQIISWGAGDYGQLGRGMLWDDAKPDFVNDIKDVTFIAAGLRHSMAIRIGIAHEVLAWGYNAYGELGLGDLNIRTQPTVINALSTGHAVSVSCGDRHSMIITSHKPLRAKDDTSLRPYFSILESEDNPALRQYLKRVMKKQGLNPDLIDDPDAILPDQPGMTDDVLDTVKFEKGLRYCMDSFPDPTDWRRKVYEICFDVATPIGTLKSVCLACARNCVPNFRLQPYTKIRKVGDTCGCRNTVYCLCSWSRIRAEFDKVCEDDGYIGPEQVRGLLLKLREPIPLDRETVVQCIAALCDDVDEQVVEGKKQRIRPVAFEKWYRECFDEYEDINAPP